MPLSQLQHPILLLLVLLTSLSSYSSSSLWTSSSVYANPNPNPAAIELSFDGSIGQEIIDGNWNVLSPKIVPKEQIDEIIQTWIPFAQSAYCPEGLETWTCTTCPTQTLPTTNITTFGGSVFQVFGYTAVTPSLKTIYIVFRGTRTLDNWISDLLIAKPDCVFEGAPEGAKVHYGFLKLWEQVREVVLERVEELVREFPGFKLGFTGHSMGGAVATLAAVDISQTLSDQVPASSINLLTFAQPRVGNAIFANWLTTLGFSLTSRIVNQDDLTPHLPPLFAGFLHFPFELWIADKNGTTLLCGEDGGDRDGDGDDDDDEFGAGTDGVLVVDDGDGGGAGVFLGGGDGEKARSSTGSRKSGSSNIIGGRFEEYPDCANRVKWKYNVSQHMWVWGEMIGAL
ncbi:hypothetical protein HDU76_008263, partial [Blyttiomyces sp. JEL0837]